MSRKNKIIVSVVGIVIVTLALLGITYAYYLTRIQGNTNTNSISLSTANLLLRYDDGSGAVVKEDIMPGVTFTKTFSVTNEGEGKVDNYVVYLEEVTNDLKRPQDFTYTLTCESTSATSPCSGTDGQFPKLAGIIANNSIDVDVTHTYTMTLTYENLTNTDQSIDMGSTIQGYIQIYNQKDIVDIQGEVTNLNEGDYAQINSIQKISQIVDGEYKFGAVAPGTHTITIRYIDEDGNEQIRSTKTITIQKSTSAGVDGDTINVTDDSQTVTINIDAGGGIFTVDEVISPYSSTFATTIYKNALNVTDEEMASGIAKLSTPLTTPGVSPNGLEGYTEGTLSSETTTYSNISYETVYYGTGYKYDKTTGLYSLTEVNNCIYKECYQNLINKYIAASDEYDFSVVSETNNLEEIYLITNANYSYDEEEGMDSVNIKYKKLTRGEPLYINEATLSNTTDDYGISYYFRGNVKNNFVTYANKCWRIVRIQGNGSVKLILADKDNGCSTSDGYLSTDTKSSYITEENILHEHNSYVNSPLELALTSWLNGGTYTYFDDKDSYQFLDATFVQNISNADQEKLFETKWCNDLNTTQRLLTNKQPSLKCSSSLTFTAKIGMINADEVVYAGNIPNQQTSNYLSTNAQGNSWILSVFNIEGNVGTWTLTNNTLLSEVQDFASLRPMVVLKPNVSISTKTDIATYGQPGTQNNPYVVE